MSNKLIIASQTSELRQIDPALSLRFIRGNRAADPEFRVLRQGKETGWAVQMGIGYAAITHWIEAEQAQQTWDYRLISQAFTALPALIRQEGI